MNYIFSFEKLEVWKESIVLVKTIYKLTDNFPDTEKFGLISQLRRASTSKVVRKGGTGKAQP